LEPRLAASDQKDLRASWKTPWSVSAGVSYQLNRGAVHATAEWFGAVGSYEVVETKPFRSQTQGDTVRIEWLGELRSVLNTGAGAEYLFSDAVTGYGSFRTDFSAAPSGDRLTVSAATWDLYHLTFGAGLHFRSFDLTIGTALAYGQDTVPHEGMDPEEGPVIPPLPDGRITYFRAKLLLGFQLFIGGRVVGMGGATSGSL
jgi:long-subunit fatty acid transport protein